MGTTIKLISGNKHITLQKVAKPITVRKTVQSLTLTRVGKEGPQGPSGRDGVDGQAASVAVGTTTTGNAGTNASVANSGTSSAAVLDFVIPRGAVGETGPVGPNPLTVSASAPANPSQGDLWYQP